MPVSVRKDGLDLAVISDRHSVEIFADGGRGYLVEAEDAGLWDPNLPWLVVAADGEYRVEEAELCPMESIWENNSSKQLIVNFTKDTGLSPTEYRKRSGEDRQA